MKVIQRYQIFEITDNIIDNGGKLISSKGWRPITFLLILPEILHNDFESEQDAKSAILKAVSKGTVNTNMTLVVLPVFIISKEGV